MFGKTAVLTADRQMLCQMGLASAILESIQRI